MTEFEGRKEMAEHKLKKRNEIEEKYKWAIEDLYAEDSKWKEEYQEIQVKLEEASSYEGRLTETADMLYEFLRLNDEIGKLFERVMVYANQKYHEDTSNAKYQDLASRSAVLGVTYSSKMAFVTPELLSAKEDAIDTFLKEKEELQVYATYLHEVMRMKAHVLPKEMENLLASAGEVTDSASNIFSMFNNADIKFPTIIGEDGNEIEITHGRYGMLMESNQREVRKEAFYGVYNTYAKFKNTLAATYSANVKAVSFNAKARKYSSTLEAELYQNNVPVSVYTNLLEVVHENLPLMHRYVSLRKKLLGVDELHMYDVYAPMVNNVTMNIDFEEAKKTVYESLAPLGEEYRAILKEGFENRWIDIYENEGKRSGAYSWGAFGTHPYVLLNYQDTLDNMFTLTHEMGHALHSYHSDATQPYSYAGYKIFVAEVASTCNEALLMEHLLKNTTDKMERAYLINHFLEQFKSTLYRQAMFAEFEMLTHKKIESNESLTADALCSIYHDLNVKYFGKDMVIDPELDMEWARIPHFYTPFYVYQYATGYSAAIAISRRILKEGKPAVDDYIRFLSGGSSKSPIELLKIAGVDMSTKEPIQQALNLFNELLDEMEALMES